MEDPGIRELLESRLNVMSRVLVWPGKSSWMRSLATALYVGVFLEFIFLNITGAIANFSDSVQTTIINAVDIGCCLAALFKVVYVTMFSNKFRKVMETLKAIEFPDKEDPLYVHLQKKLKLNNFLVTAFKYCALGTMVSQAIPSIYVTCFGEGRKLPIQTYLDDNKLPLWLFWSIFAGQLGFAIAACYQISYFDCTCFAFIGFAVAKLRIINKRLYEVNNIIDHSKLTVGAYDDQVKVLLSQSIREQVLVDHFVNAIQDAFSIPILAELAVVLILVSVVLIGMVLTPFPSVDFLCNICVLLSLMIGNAGFCFHGNELQVESEELWEAQYLLDWHYFGTSQRKTVFIMMERTIRRLQITAGPFAVLNNETFLSICNTAFSYFTIMLNLYSE